MRTRRNRFQVGLSPILFQAVQIQVAVTAVPGPVSCNSLHILSMLLRYLFVGSAENQCVRLSLAGKKVVKKHTACIGDQTRADHASAVSLISKSWTPSWSTIASI